MFGDREAYLDKFKTCARTRSYENRILGKEFYEREPSKPLFNNNSILTVHNLHKYHCLIEMFKIIKLHMPISMYELFKQSRIRDDKLISLSPSTLFDYQASNLWIRCRKSEMDFTTSIQTVKLKLKNSLLTKQSEFGSDWHSYNFDTEHFEF